MHAGNPSSKSKCWICEEDNGLAFFVGDMKGGVRWGAYLRCIPTGGRVGDYVHATCRILCILVKRLRGEFHQRGIHVGVRELDGEMHEIKEFCKGIPEAERIAPRRAKEGSFDLTSANAFMATPNGQTTLSPLPRHVWGMWRPLQGLWYGWSFVPSCTSLHISIGFGGKKNFLQIVMLPCTLMRGTASARHGGT